MPPLPMYAFGGKVICGKEAHPSEVQSTYLSTQLVDGGCPPNYASCAIENDGVSPQNQVCVKLESIYDKNVSQLKVNRCPITDIIITEAEDVPKGYKSVLFTSNLTIVYSKSTKNAPITIT